MLFSPIHVSFMMLRKLRWSWVFFGWLSPSRVRSAESGGKSPFPSARISAAAPSQNRTVSHSADCPWCDLWCMNPDWPVHNIHGSCKRWNAFARTIFFFFTPFEHSPLYKTGWQCILQRFSWLLRPSWTVTWSSCILHTPARIPDSPRWILFARKLWTPPDHLTQKNKKEERRINKSTTVSWQPHSSSAPKIAFESSGWNKARHKNPLKTTHSSPRWHHFLDLKLPHYSMAHPSFLWWMDKGMRVWVKQLLLPLGAFSLNLRKKASTRKNSRNPCPPTAAVCTFPFPWITSTDKHKANRSLSFLTSFW